MIAPVSPADSAPDISVAHKNTRILSLFDRRGRRWTSQAVSNSVYKLKSLYCICDSNQRKVSSEIALKLL